MQKMYSKVSTEKTHDGQRHGKNTVMLMPWPQGQILWPWPSTSKALTLLSMALVLVSAHFGEAMHSAVASRSIFILYI